MQRDGRMKPDIEQPVIGVTAWRGTWKGDLAKMESSLGVGSLYINNGTPARSFALTKERRYTLWKVKRMRLEFGRSRTQWTIALPSGLFSLILSNTAFTTRSQRTAWNW